MILTPLWPCKIAKLLDNGTGEPQGGKVKGAKSPFFLLSLSHRISHKHLDSPQRRKVRLSLHDSRRDKAREEYCRQFAIKQGVSICFWQRMFSLHYFWTSAGEQETMSILCRVLLETGERLWRQQQWKEERSESRKERPFFTLFQLQQNAAANGFVLEADSRARSRKRGSLDTNGGLDLDDLSFEVGLEQVSPWVATSIQVMQFGWASDRSRLWLSWRCQHSFNSSSASSSSREFKLLLLGILGGEIK